MTAVDASFDDDDAENDAFFFTAPLLPLSELQERLDRVELFCVQLALDGPSAQTFMRRAQQARYAVAACARQTFSTNLRRALVVKVLDLEAEAKAVVRIARRRLPRG